MGGGKDRGIERTERGRETGEGRREGEGEKGQRGRERNEKFLNRRGP